MTVVDVLGRVDELADGTGGTVDAVRGDGNRSISEIPAYSHQAAACAAAARDRHHLLGRRVHALRDVRSAGLGYLELTGYWRQVTL